MATTTLSLGGGLTDTANQSTSFTTGTDIVSSVVLETAGTYVSGGFDSLGNSYTTRPVTVVDVSVKVATTAPTGNRFVAAQFSSSNTGSPSSSSGGGNIASSYPSTITLSTASTFKYDAFAGSTPYYYGFEGTNYTTSTILYGNGGSSGSIFRDGTVISSTTKLSGSITYDSIPNAPTDLSVNLASITDTTANISWTAPTDDGGDNSTIKGYRINYRTSPSDNWAVLVANTGSSTTSRQLTSLSSSTTYSIQIAALNDVTDSFNSTYTSITNHVGVRSATLSFTTAESIHDIRIWDGSAFKNGMVKVWNGSTWLQYPNIRVKIWNGTAFEDATLSS